MRLIRPCRPGDFDAIFAIINEAAEAYRGVIAADCWHDPYMSRDELEREMAQGVSFRARTEDDRIVAVMGLQHVSDVALIRHAYTSPADQRRGHGEVLLADLRERTARPILVGTWKAADWAVRFYEKHGFRQAGPELTKRLLRRYWTVSPRQIEESVVLAEPAWLARRGGDTR